MRYYIYSQVTSEILATLENNSTLTIEEWKAEQNTKVSKQISKHNVFIQFLSINTCIGSFEFVHVQ